MFKNLSGLAQLMRHASSMGDRVKELRASLAEARATGDAGDGRVHVEVTGLGVVTRLRLSPELNEGGDLRQLEELIPVALNEALAKVRAMHIEKVREATGGIDMPGLEEALANL